jgi:ATP-binding cassette, subfamily F, member 3
MLLQVTNLSKAYGENTILQGVFLQVQAGERIGIVGANGAGKTTLFRCIIGLETPDTGEIHITEGVRLGYLQQNTDWSASGSVWDELVDVYADVIQLKHCIDVLAEKMAHVELPTHELDEVMKEYGKHVDWFERADGYNIEFTIKRVARGLGFSEIDERRLVSTLSGGEKTRLSLAKLLLRKPDLLLLDEPTNHLDIQMVEWLESFLLEYGGGVIVISHDRYFLDRVTNKTFAVESGTGTMYPGNYSQYILLKEEQREASERAFDKQKKWIEKTEAFIDRYRAGIKAKQARGRLSQLSRVERLSRPDEERMLGDIVFEPMERSGDRVLDLVDIEVKYDNQVILTNINCAIRRGEGVALVGPNGAGKTTLLKVITGQVKRNFGQCRIGSKVKIGYFSQHHENVTLENSALVEIMNEFGFTENVARKYLALFLFQGDDVFKRIVELSGGERARIVLLKLLLSGANFLILDEPTNHLDIPSKEAVEEALQNYAGTFLVVSHDRYFLDRIVNRVLDLEKGKIHEYLGGYTYFQNKKKEKAINNTPQPTVLVENKGIKDRKEKHQKINYAKLITEIEKEIAMMEAEIKEVTQLLSNENVYEDITVISQLTERYQNLTQKLNDKMEEWESCMLAVNEQNNAEI